MIVSESMEQLSEEWFLARKGRATASQFSKIFTPTGRVSKSSVSYMRKLARECVCEDPMEFQGNKHTDWGNDNEADARELFEKTMGLEVHEVGFCSPDNGAPYGFSPDGLIKDADGEYYEGLEIKAPGVDKHVEYLLNGELPNEYKMQVHGSLAISGFNHWHFMSYFPNLTPLIIKIERDEFTDKLASALDDFVVDYAKERERVIEAILPKGDSE